jgi:dienelactone hydrolase
MGMRTVRWAVAVTVVLALGGCGLPAGKPVNAAAERPTATADASRAASLSPSAGASKAAAQASPSGTVAAQAPVRTTPVETFSVGVRQLQLSRGDRPLRTVVWYPAVGTIGAPATNAAPAAGAYPLVLFSHGLGANPESYQSITEWLASAGFIVAAPAYPYTNSDASSFNPADLINQPADGSAVIDGLLALNATPGDPLAGHIDPSRIAAAGHSGGGYTTMGLVQGARDDRLSAAIVIAGGSLGGSFTGPPASVLFIHGDKDPIVSYPIGQAAYGMVPWPKALLTVVGGDHTGYLFNPGPATSAVAASMLDFLRFTLYSDANAKARLPVEATVAGATTYESTL